MEKNLSSMCTDTHIRRHTGTLLHAVCTVHRNWAAFSGPQDFLSVRPYMNQIPFTGADSWGTRRNGVDRRVLTSNCRSLGDPVTNPGRYKEAGLCPWTLDLLKPFSSRSESLDVVIRPEGLLLSASSRLSDSCLPAMSLLCVAGRQVGHWGLMFQLHFPEQT